MPDLRRGELMARIRAAPIPDRKRVMVLIDRLHPLAAEYYKLTGKPLGVAGEIGKLGGGRAARPSPRGSEAGGLLPT
jgi:hypothetical protein